MQAEIVLKTKSPTLKKPLLFSVGSFTAVSKDGREFSFDWLKTSTCSCLDGDGNFLFITTLADFDEKVFADCNLEKSGVKTEEITPRFIVESKLLEVNYECFADKKESIHIDLELVNFDIYVDTSINRFDIYSFPQSEVDQYNERVAANERALRCTC